MKFTELLPDDLMAAFVTLRVAVGDAAPHSLIRRRYVLFYSWLFAVGCWVGVGLVVCGLVDLQSTDLWRILITALAVLSGFVISTMAFTGKVESVETLTFEQLRQFIGKSNHLLVSQFLTLCCHLTGIAALVVLVVSNSGKVSYGESVAVLMFGLIFTSAFRSLLVPLQIIELHRFAHAALLEEKAKDVEEAAAEL